MLDFDCSRLGILHIENEGEKTNVGLNAVVHTRRYFTKVNVIL